MKFGPFIVAFMLITSSAVAQEIQMTQGARKSYVKKEKEPAVLDAQQSQNASDTKPIAMAFAALEVKMHDVNGPIGIDLETGSRELNPRTAKVSYEELQKLARNLVPYESHIDVLNYLSDSGWEVISIHVLPYSRENQIHTTRIYVRRAVMQ